MLFLVQARSQSLTHNPIIRESQTWETFPVSLLLAPKHEQRHYIVKEASHIEHQHYTVTKALYNEPEPYVVYEALYHKS